MTFVRNFQEINKNDISQVGGKNASLGEMVKTLSKSGVNVPGGFATTAEAYWQFLEENGIREELTEILSTLDRDKFSNLKNIGEQCRNTIQKSKFPKDVSQAISDAYQKLCQEHGEDTEVAVRSSATAEDLPTASFAGQLESFLSISGEEELLSACEQCFASLFTDRAIKYREDNGFPHMEVALSVGVQKMVRSDIACSGVAFTLDPDTGFENVVTITGGWGLGENIVQGTIDPDEFYLFKPSLREGKKSIISRRTGRKQETMVRAEHVDHKPGVKTINVDTPEEKRRKQVLNEEELEELGKQCLLIEDHYECPMDIEWAKDGVDEKMYIVQARPETVHSSDESPFEFHSYEMKEKGKVLAKGVALGDRIASGKTRILNSPEESDKLQEGEILVTDSTDPDWDPIMKKAAAIITNKGGRTSHAAIVAREVGAVAVVGTGDATKHITDGQIVTVSCAEGQTGVIYDGKLDYTEEVVDTREVKLPETAPMLILADPSQAFKWSFLPNKGVGLMRLEFVINNIVGVHPRALTDFDELEDPKVKEKIDQLSIGYSNKESYFVDRLTQGVATIAAAFHPKEVIVRMSDFKSNEYANLIGGRQFEPEEENPMLGFRGASRYYHPFYKEGFRLECEAMKRVREEMGLTNVKLMIPFCRTPEEGEKVVKLMRSYGLVQGENGLEIYAMIEIPSNILQAKELARIFDGFSIGSNDLTQLTLGLDRDSSLVNELFDEENPAVKEMIRKLMLSAEATETKVGLCGQAPSDLPDFAAFLVENGVDSISFNPDALLKGIANINKAEEERRNRDKGKFPMEGTYM